ncbi:hypothetical protein ACH4OY_26370 [Micromonospora rubida]|uniref:Thioesterase family protein n=1 Tax=Micromonospora rubida TaxID=2697657 RepID=A0ABW7STK3_9ACTN
MTVTIPVRFNGPPGSGNGGWTAAALAAAAGHDGPVEVTLRQPPPLETPLTVADWEVRDPGGRLIAEMRPAGDAPEAVPPVDLGTARAAAAAYPGLAEHPFPGCYVCGPDRIDGLRIFPGRLPDGRTAAPFTAPAEVTPETVWAALDCSGGWAVIGPGRPYVLGRIAVVLDALPAPGDECVVTGVADDARGRKALVRTALYGPGGRLLGRARATWIALPGA